MGPHGFRFSSSILRLAATAACVLSLPAAAPATAGPAHILDPNLSTSADASPAAFPGANGRIAFTYNPSFDQTEIWSVRPDGSRRRPIITDQNSRWQSWSPDGREFAYVVGYCCSQDVWVAKADGSGRRQLTDNENYEQWPSWSADGTKILFRRYVGEPLGDEVFIMDAADGSDVVNLTNNPGFDEQPVMAADGTIVFVSARDSATTDIYTMNSDGSNVTRITTDPANDSWPDWAPDSSKILFARELDENRSNLYVIDSDGTNETQLTSGSYDFQGVFSPDGSQIAFGSHRGGGALWVMNADGSGMHQVTSGPPSGAPDWRPSPCTITGTDGDDTIEGTSGDDRICAKPGNDAVSARAGNDTVRGGPGNDELVGGAGSDIVRGRRDNDLVRTADGIEGNDEARGGPGTDVCIVDPGDLTVGCEEVQIWQAS